MNQFPVGNHAGLNRQEAEARLLEDFNQLVTIMLREESLYSGIPGSHSDRFRFGGVLIRDNPYRS